MQIQALTVEIQILVTSSLFNMSDLSKIYWQVFAVAIHDDQYLKGGCGQFPELNFIPKSKDLRSRDQGWKLKLKPLLLDKKEEVFQWVTDQQESLRGIIDYVWEKYLDRSDPERIKAKMAETGPELWKMLHVFAYFWKGKKTSAIKFLGFFSRKILCGQCRSDWQKIVSELPPDLKTDESLFAWTVLVHNEVNKKLGKPELSLDEAIQLYKDEKRLPSYLGESPKEWGPGLWDLLHNRAFSVKSLDSELEWVSGEFTDLIPDEEVREHWRNFIKISPPDLSSPENYLMWTINVHNLVNLALGKKRFSDQIALEKYSK